MKTDDKILMVAYKLVVALNKASDDQLPGRLADIVKLHSGLAVGSALIPVPGADIAASIANIWTMYVRINGELKMPFEENAIKSIAAGIATNLGGAYAGSLILGGIFKLIPGLGSAGGAIIMLATIYGITLASGVIYMKALTVLAEGSGSGPMTVQDVQRATDEVLRDKNFVSEAVEAGKAMYKEQKDTSKTPAPSVVPSGANKGLLGQLREQLDTDGLTCPHCRTFSKHFRLVNPSDGSGFYFICKECGRSVALTDFPD